VGSKIFDFLYVVLNISSFNVVFPKREYVYSKDDDLCIPLIFDNRRAAFLETVDG